MKPACVAPLLIGLFSLAACRRAESPREPAPPLAWARVAPEQIAEAKKHGVPVAFENDLGMRFVLIPGGTFLMGSPEDEVGRGKDEPQHEVTIAKPFYMQITEITVREYEAQRLALRVRSNPPPGSYPPARARLPVSDFYNQVVIYAAWLSASETPRSYRLPTEAEWERACRAGATSAFATGDTISTTQANIGSGVRNEQGYPVSTKVGSYAPNAWGLYDMHGNVREWCLDCYAPYPTEPSTDSVADSSTPTRCNRVQRGGSLREAGRAARSACRAQELGETFSMGLEYPTGFRLVSPLPEPKDRE